eukprot:scaffold102089_cov31-Cyclotella_meneghiniana.AAC.2
MVARATRPTGAGRGQEEYSRQDSTLPTTYRPCTGIQQRKGLLRFNAALPYRSSQFRLSAMKNLIIIISLIGAEVAVAKDLSKNLRAVETLEKEIVSEEVVCRADGRFTFNGSCDACCSKSCVGLQNWLPESWKKCQSV